MPAPIDVDVVAEVVGVDVDDVESVVDVESTVVSVVDVDSVVVVPVVPTVVAAVVEGALVVGGGLIDSTADVDSGGISDGSPGPMGSLASGERIFGPIWGPDGIVVELGGVSVTSLISASPPTSDSTVIALNARGATTASAVTVDNDSASRNRLPPVFSSGRCRYMANQVGLGGCG